jgi:tRNA pseudouridine55 synthase
MTSHDVVVTIRKLVRQRRVGHAGTLDPMATGVLLVCLGQATRVSEYLMRSTKTYRGAVHLGVSTTTDDIEGEVIETSRVTVDQGDIEDALSHFEGRILQIPPTYSAIKVRGKRMYDLARQGEAVEIRARPVDVQELRLLAWEPPVAHLEVRCGPGTYVRALARDLGQILGCGGHLSALRRLSSGSFSVLDAVTLNRLDQAAQNGELERYMHPLDVAFCDLPALHLEDEDAYRLATGQRIESRTELEDGACARAYGPDGRFIALVCWDQQRVAWQPRKVFLSPDALVRSSSMDVHPEADHVCADK